jgi:hypothetical protein
MNLSSILSLFLFIPVSFIVFYIPGRVLLHYLKVKFSKLENLILSFFLGISIFLLTTYIVTWAGFKQAEYFILFIFLCLFIYQLRRYKLKFLLKFTSYEYVLMGIIILCSFMYTSFTFFSGWMSKDGLQFIGVNEADGLVHVSRIKNLADFFPPQHPGLADIPFRGYHFFYDFLLSQFYQLFKFNVLDLYFRDFSLFISILFGLSLVFASRQLKLSKLATVLTIVLAFATPGFVMVGEWLFHKEVILSILVPGNYIFDPSMILGVSFLLVGLSLLPQAATSTKLAIIVGLLLGVLAQIKVYTGIIAIVVICLYGFYIVIRTRSIHQIPYIIVGILTAILTAITFLPNNIGSGSFIWAPFLFYEHFMGQVAFQNSYWEVKRRIFLEHNNIPRLTILYAQAITLFIVYAVGIKLIIVAKIFSIFKKKFWINDYNSIFLVAILTGFIIPTFFIQSVSLFDIGQFFAVSIILLSIPAAYTTSWLYKKNKLIGAGAIALILFFAFSEGIQVEKEYLLPQSPLVISPKELSIYSHITQNTKPTNFIISIPQPIISQDQVKLNWYKPSLVSALTGRSIYFEDEIIQNPKTERTRKNREQNLTDLAQYIHICSPEDIIRKVEKIGSPYITTQQPENCLKNISDSSVESTTVSFYKIHY